MRRMPKRLLADKISFFGISPRTLTRSFKKRNTKSHFARKKPWINEENRIKQLNWAKLHKNWTKEDCGLNLNLLVRTPSRMNGEKYGDIILDTIYPIVMIAKEAIFQEDNAPIYKSKPVKELKDDLGIKLNPIENAWREVKCWIHKNRKPQTEADLEEAVLSAWNTITFEKFFIL
ncbi:11333_t:CDS:2 [Ambispora leptoticha]|uniref:11333_t:CDS:1 n=1 Tax=Ambispora leptoticha TaxID=144679 RepID=A0A9N9AFI3_9GLOM|nr:11333_t:CDS:2 [Ambispora leptoticha]